MVMEMVTVQNKQKLYEDVCAVVIDYYLYDRMSKIEETQIIDDIYTKITDVIEHDLEIDSLLIEQDKNKIHAHFCLDGQYKIILYKISGEEIITLLEITILQYDVKYLAKHIIVGKYKVNFFKKSDRDNPQLIFFRNKIGIIPDSDLVCKKYNRIQNVLLNFLTQKPFNRPSNCLMLNSCIDDYKKYNENFFDHFLSNYCCSTVDEDYFSKILTLSEEDSRIETIWIYHKEYLKEMGFNYKSDIKDFENHFDNINKHFHPYDVKPLFNFRSKKIQIIFDTGEKWPIKNVFVKINKDDAIEDILNKELYRYLYISNDDYVKIENILLKDYIENKDEVVQMIKLMNY